METDNSKNTKPASPRTFIDGETGEKLELQPVEENVDNNFYKIFLYKFEKTLGGIMNQKMQLVLWLIKHMSSSNELRYSYREIEAASGISYKTVARTIQQLKKNDFLCGSGKMLIINPDVVFRGKYSQRGRVRDRYSRARDEENASPKKKTKALPLDVRESVEKQIEQLQKEIGRLKKKRDYLELNLLIPDDDSSNTMAQQEVGKEAPQNPVSPDNKAIQETGDKPPQNPDSYSSVPAQPDDNEELPFAVGPEYPVKETPLFLFGRPEAEGKV